VTGLNEAFFIVKVKNLRQSVSFFKIILVCSKRCVYYLRIEQSFFTDTCVFSLGREECIY
jgi:hypothetical protein